MNAETGSIHNHVREKRPISVEDLKQQRKPVRNANQDYEASLSVMDKLAIFITERVGTMGFFFIIFIWTTFWLAWNFLAPKRLQFDPPMAFVFWLFISNMVQIFLMPLIMVGQNLQGRHSEQRAEADFEVNVRAEHEIEVILRHLEYQNTILQHMLETFTSGIDPNKSQPALAVKAVSADSDPTKGSG